MQHSHERAHIAAWRRRCAQVYGIYYVDMSHVCTPRCKLVRWTGPGVCGIAGCDIQFYGCEESGVYHFCGTDRCRRVVSTRDVVLADGASLAYTDASCYGAGTACVFSGREQRDREYAPENWYEETTDTIGFMQPGFAAGGRRWDATDDGRLDGDGGSSVVPKGAHRLQREAMSRISDVSTRAGAEQATIAVVSALNKKVETAARIAAKRGRRGRGNKSASDADAPSDKESASEEEAVGEDNGHAADEAVAEEDGAREDAGYSGDSDAADEDGAGELDGDDGDEDGVGAELAYDDIMDAVEEGAQPLGASSSRVSASNGERRPSRVRFREALASIIKLPRVPRQGPRRAKRARGGDEDGDADGMGISAERARASQLAMQARMHRMQQEQIFRAQQARAQGHYTGSGASSARPQKQHPRRQHPAQTNALHATIEHVHTVKYNGIVNRGREQVTHKARMKQAKAATETRSTLLALAARVPRRAPSVPAEAAPPALPAVGAAIPSTTAYQYKKHAWWVFSRADSAPGAPRLISRESLLSWRDLHDYGTTWPSATSTTTTTTSAQDRPRATSSSHPQADAYSDFASATGIFQGDQVKVAEDACIVCDDYFWCDVGLSAAVQDAVDFLGADMAAFYPPTTTRSDSEIAARPLSAGGRAVVIDLAEATRATEIPRGAFDFETGPASRAAGISRLICELRSSAIAASPDAVRDDPASRAALALFALVLESNCIQSKALYSVLVESTSAAHRAIQLHAERRAILDIFCAAFRRALSESAPSVAAGTVAVATTTAAAAAPLNRRHRPVDAVHRARVELVRVIYDLLGTRLHRGVLSDVMASALAPT